MANASEISIGLFAPAFPRDPLNVNVYLEHVLVGQVIEPLFTLGDDGIIKGAVAEKWEFNKDHTEVKVTIRKGITFSNGKKLTSEDVKFSLDRHILNPVSQSYNYLQVIKSLKILSQDQIVFELKHPYVPFLLSLSRDQLGILPKEWVFKSESSEPFTGSGPYRLIKENGQWNLSPNNKYRNPSEVSIKKWRVDIIDTAKSSYPKIPSDLILLALGPVKQSLIKTYSNFSKTHNESKAFSFYQYSFWWLKDHYKSFSETDRIQIKSALKILSELIVATTRGEISTGIIPSGISGSLQETLPPEKTSTLKDIKIKLVVPHTLIEVIKDLTINNSKLKSTRVSIELLPFLLTDVAKIKSMDATMVLIGFAGGFYDPEGYLTVLPSLIGRSTQQLFGETAESIRMKAEKEFDGKLRADLYRQFSIVAQQEMRYIPGYVPYFSEFRSLKLIKKPTAFKYSYKLTDYQVSKEGGPQ